MELEQAPPIEIRKSRSFSEQINVTFAFLRANFKPLAKAVLFIVGPAAVVAGALIGYFFFDVISIDPELGGRNAIFHSIPSLLIGGLFAFVSTILLYGVVIDYVRLYLDRQGANFSLNELWTEVKGDLGRITGTLFGIGAIALAAYIILVVIVASRIWFLVALFLIAAIGVVLYMYVPLMLVMPVRLCEEDGIWASISRCFELVKGYWWKTFGVILIPSMVANAISSVVIFPAEIVISFARVGTIGPPGAGVKVLVTVLMMVGMMLAYLLAALPTLGATLQYFNLVEKHEGVGLMGRIQSIGEEDESTLNANIN